MSGMGPGIEVPVLASIDIAAVVAVFLLRLGPVTVLAAARLPATSLGP